jgi:hypothetical protein
MKLEVGLSLGSTCSFESGMESSAGARRANHDNIPSN